MKNNTKILLGINRLLRLNERLLKDVCARYNLSSVETDIISFLHNNPERDTAADIVELRLLSKGCVSKAVESLMEQGYIIRTQDPSDRRRQHLKLTEQASPVTRMIDQSHRKLYGILLSGFDRQDTESFEMYMDRIFANIRAAAGTDINFDNHSEEKGGSIHE